MDDLTYAQGYRSAIDSSLELLEKHRSSICSGDLRSGIAFNRLVKELLDIKVSAEKTENLGSQEVSSLCQSK